jgi:hypothetical protein
MSSAKVWLGAGLVAIGLSACGSTAKPQVGSPAALHSEHKGLDDARTKHVTCLRAEHIPVRQLYVKGYPGFQVGTAPQGPTVEFLATPGAAQFAQIDGSAQSAEVIGSALLYPNQAPDKLLSKVESCVAKGVQG